MKRLRRSFAIGAAAIGALAACNDLIELRDPGDPRDASADAESGANAPDAGPRDAGRDVEVPTPKRCDQAPRPGAEAPRCLGFDDDAGPFLGFDRVEKSDGKFHIGSAFATGPSLFTQIAYTAAPKGEAFGAFAIQPVGGPDAVRFTIEADVVIKEARAGLSLLLAVELQTCGSIVAAAVEAELGDTDRFFIRNGLAAEPRIEAFPGVRFHLMLAVDDARANGNGPATETVIVNGVPLPSRQVQLSSTCGKLEARVGIHKSSAPSGDATVSFDNVVYWNE